MNRSLTAGHDQSFIGFGVGGEYPTSASSAAEKAQSMSGKGTKRGAIVGMTFSCQGAGAVFGSIVILILLLITNEGVHDCFEPGLNEDGHENDLSIVWRITYGIGYVQTLGVLAGLGPGRG
jgi:MFS family permease